MKNGILLQNGAETRHTIQNEPTLIHDTALTLFEQAKGSHAWDHTLRVCELCRQIGPQEGADMAVLISAAYLHDIGRAYEDATNGSVCHAKKGAALAIPIVAGLPFDDGQKKNIIHSIRSHRFRDDRAPESIEAKVLFDADKLDSIGAVGIARAFLFAGEVGARLHNPDVDVHKTQAYSADDTGYREYQLKLRHIKERILTPTGKKLAMARHAYMVQFFEHFLEEYEAKR